MTGRRGRGVLIWIVLGVVALASGLQLLQSLRFTLLLAKSPALDGLCGWDVMDT